MTFKSLIENKHVAYKNCFNTDAGEKVLKDLYKATKINRSSYNTDTHFMAKEEGRKEVFRYIINTLNLDLEKVLKEGDVNV